MPKHPCSFVTKIASSPLVANSNARIKNKKKASPFHAPRMPSNENAQWYITKPWKKKLRSHPCPKLKHDRQLSSLLILVPSSSDDTRSSSNHSNPTFACLQTLPHDQLGRRSSSKPFLLSTAVAQIPLSFGSHAQDTQDHVVVGISLDLFTLLFLGLLHGTQVAAHHNAFRAAGVGNRCEDAAVGCATDGAESRRCGEAVQAGGSLLLASGGSSCHRFGGTDEVVGGLKVEEVEVLEVMVFGRLEDIERHAQDFVRLFVNSVEEIEENLAVLVNHLL